MAQRALVSGTGRSRHTRVTFALGDLARGGQAGAVRDQAEDEGRGEELKLRFFGHPRKMSPGRRDGIPSLRRGQCSRRRES